MSSPVVVGLVGRTGAGKETLTKILIRLLFPLTVVHLSTSRFLEGRLKSMGIVPSTERRQWLALEMQKESGPDALTKALESQVLLSSEDVVVYDCIRFQSDFDFVRRDRHNLIVYITAPERHCFDRVVLRNEKPGDAELTFEEFRERENRATEIEIPRFGKEADFTIVNDAPLAEGALEHAVAFLAQFYVKPRIERKKSQAADR